MNPYDNCSLLLWCLFSKNNKATHGETFNRKVDKILKQPASFSLNKHAMMYKRRIFVVEFATIRTTGK